MVTTQLSTVNVQYRSTFWSFVKFKPGIITIDHGKQTLDLTDATTKVSVFSSPIKDILYQFAGRNFIIISHGKRIYIDFNNGTGPTDEEVAGVAAGAVGAAIGLAGSGVMAAGQQTAEINKQQQSMKSSTGYKQLEQIFTQMGGTASKKPGKAVVGTTYGIVLAVVGLIFLAKFSNPVYLLTYLAVAVFLVISYIKS